MSMSTTLPVTLEQFEKLDLPEDRGWELHEGELVEMTQPSYMHKLIQHRLFQLLTPMFKGRADVMIEMPYCVKNRHDDYRSADVGIVSTARVPGIPQERIVNGAPEFVIEVLSPSNTVREINKRKHVCAQNGGELFWVVDPDELEVTAIDLNNPRIERKYGCGASVPIQVLDVETELSVSAIFAGIVGRVEQTACP